MTGLILAAFLTLPAAPGALVYSGPIAEASIGVYPTPEIVSMSGVQAVDDTTRAHRVARVAIIGMNVAQFADISTTMYMSGKGGFVEANPLLRPFYRSPVKMALVKGGIATLSAWALVKIHKKQPRIAAVTAAVLAGATGYVAWQNSRLERGQR